MAGVGGYPSDGGPQRTWSSYIASPIKSLLGQGPKESAPEERGGTDHQTQPQATDMDKEWEKIPYQDHADSFILRIAELERRLQIAEQSAKLKESAIADLTKQLKPKSGKTTSKRKHDNDGAQLIAKIDDFQKIKEQLTAELKHKEEQRYQAAQQVLALRQELSSSQHHIENLKHRYKELADANKQMEWEMKQLSEMAPEDIPEDVDVRLLVSQLRARVNMLERENQQVKEHTKQQSKHIQIMKQEQEGIKFHEGDLELLKCTCKDLEGHNKALSDELRRIKEENQLLKSQVDAEQAKAMTYKLDFDDEREDRIKAHSRYADLEVEMAELKNVTRALASNDVTGDIELATVLEHSSLGGGERDRELEQWKEEALQSREDLQAKTSQVKAYKKQVNQYKEKLELAEKQVIQSTEGLLRQITSLNLDKKHLEERSGDLAETVEQLELKIRELELLIRAGLTSSVGEMKIKEGQYTGLETERIRGDLQQAQNECSKLLASLEQCRDESEHCIAEVRGQCEQETNKRIQQQRQALRVFKQLDRRVKELVMFSPSIKGKEVVESLRPYSQEVKEFSVISKTPIQYYDRNRIGSGSFGSVYAVNLNGIPCIAKRLHDILMGRGKQENVSLTEKQVCHEKFCRECVLMSRAKHVNVVKFIGVHFGKDEFDLTLFMEQLHTDLKVYLSSTPDVPLPTKISILHDVSCGLLYLHEECSIIHRDLTAANVLLTADNRAKIADLGVSRIFNRTFLQLSKIPGTLPYMPPEALKDSAKYDESLDVFSFGVLTLFVGIQMSPDLSWDHVPDDVHAKGEQEIFKRKKWIEMMEQAQPELNFLVLWCLCDDPKCRPSTYCVNVILQEMKRDH